MKNIIIVTALALLISGCSTDQSKFAPFIEKDKYCDFIKVESIKKVLSITDKITTQTIGGLFSSCIIEWGEVNWDTDEDNRKSIDTNLTKIRPKEKFPPVKLSEAELTKHNNNENEKARENKYVKDLKLSASALDQMFIDSDRIRRDANNYEIIKNIGDATILIKHVTNNDEYQEKLLGDYAELQGDEVSYEVKILSGDIVLTIIVGETIFPNKPKETAIKLARQIMADME